MDFLFTGRDQRFTDYPPHTHGFWELLLHLEGSGTADIGGKEYAFSPGTIFCIRPGVEHSQKAPGGFVDGGVLVSSFPLAEECGDVMVFQDDENGSFRDLYFLGRRFQENAGQDMPSEQFLRCILEAMENLLLHWKQVRRLNSEAEKLQRILRSHVGDAGFQLREAIDQSDYSPNHLRTVFRENFGCSPLQYLNRLRVEAAQHLILQHKSIMTIAEIAAACGFEDPLYFSRVFRKQTGLSPIQFYEQSRSFDRSQMASDMRPEDL